MLRLKTHEATRKGTMRKILLFIFIFFNTNFLYSEVKSVINSLEKIPYKKSIKESILEGEIFSESTVKDFEQNKKKMQSLNFSIAGLHKKSCSYALVKLSQYENYNKFISFVKESYYNNKTGEISFLLSHLLLPYDMQLIFKLPRIKAPGTYPFSFELGFLKGLVGNIHVINHQNRCLFYSEAKWSGPDTGLNATLFEMFSQGLSKISMETLFRISQTMAH